MEAEGAGYVSLGLDLLSRQGGTARFPDPVDATAAYNRTRPAENVSDNGTNRFIIVNPPAGKRFYRLISP